MFGIFYQIFFYSLYDFLSLILHPSLCLSLCEFMWLGCFLSSFASIFSLYPGIQAVGRKGSLFCIIYFPFCLIIKYIIYTANFIINISFFLSSFSSFSFLFSCLSIYFPFSIYPNIRGQERKRYLLKSCFLCLLLILI